MNMTDMTDDDILDYLMTSEFNEGLSDKEAQFLLLKFRQYYRFQVSKNTQQIHKYEELEKTSKEEYELLEKLNSSNLFDLQAAQRKNELELKRKLTFRERFFGKIKRN